MDWINRLKQQFGDKVEENKKFSELTTLKIGGEIKAFIEVNSPDELVDMLKFITKKNTPFLIIGGGSNLLVSDEGVELLVIKNNVTGITQNDNRLTVQSGTVLQDLVNYTIEHGLSGLHKMTGIPGTVGGAIYGNAGAYGQTISNHITSVKFFDGESVRQFSKDECGFDYRFSSFKKDKSLIILEAEFELPNDDSERLKQESDDILETRLKRYPKGIMCPGSFFKNVVADTLTPQQLAKAPQEKIVYSKLPAGVLLEEVGAKGDSFKGITIAPYHANLFINTGSGTAENFYKLAKKYFEKVKEKYGIELEPEVQLINLPPLN